MHELPVTKEIMQIALKYAKDNNALKIVRVTVKVGEIRDMIEHVTQRYWDYISRDTIAEGAKIKFNYVPIRFLCEDCGKLYEVDIRSLNKINCSKCDSLEASLINGKELSIEDIEIVTSNPEKETKKKNQGKSDD